MQLSLFPPLLQLCALAVLAVKEADKTKPSGQTKIKLFFMFEFLLLK